MALPSEAPEATNSSPEETPIRVLIVDDDPNIRTLLEVLMGMEGFEVVGVVADGTEAVATSMRTQPDVVILDYMMPKMDGGEAAELIRAAVPKVRILAFSGVMRELPEWADHFVEKGDMAGISRLLGRS